MTPAFWKDRRVLITGHTGFKGAWLSAWLVELGARVTGVALPPNTTPNLYDLIGLSTAVHSHLFDINDRSRLAEVLAQHRPEIVFHLAAQSLVRRSYREPLETFRTNVIGTVTLLDAIREAASVKSVVVVTSDKCYENRESSRGYRESDRLGGHDPYSASKGCAEIATASVRRSFFAPYAPHGHPARIATARAGNVIGGGDWAEDRIVPDVVRGCLGSAGQVTVRAPTAVRPWQHVLEPLRGYLDLAERLTTAPDGFDEAWNFGPGSGAERTVLEVAETLVARFGQGRVVVEGDSSAPHETRILRLDHTKARELGWTPALEFEDALRLTGDWYLAWARGADLADLTRSQLSTYTSNFAAGRS